MKRYLIAIALALCSIGASTANASGWYWIPDHATGYFIKSDGTRNDGWYYVRKGCCGHYDYVQVKAIVPKVEYSPNWTTEVARAKYQLEDKNLFLKALKELRGGHDYSSSYLASETIQSGIQLYEPDDGGNALAHAAERMGLRAYDSATQLGAKIVDGAEKYSEAKSQELGYKAFLNYLNTPKTVTRTYSQQSSTTGVSAFGDSTLIGKQLATIHCAKCHSGANAKGDLDLIGIASYGAEDRKAIRADAVAQMQSGEMPKGGAKLPDWQIAAIADWISPPEENAVKVYAPKVKAQAEVPPVPNPPSSNP